MISSNAVLSRKRVWMKKRDFAEIQREVEAFRIERFPELGATRHYDSEQQGMKKTAREQTASLRSGQPSHKEQLAGTLKTVLQQARSREALETAVAGLGFMLYQRGRSVGIQTEGRRRYRLSTLGLAEDYTDAVTRFELAESRMESLKQGRARRSTEAERES